VLTVPLHFSSYISKKKAPSQRPRKRCNVFSPLYACYPSQRPYLFNVAQYSTSRSAPLPTSVIILLNIPTVFVLTTSVLCQTDTRKPLPTRRISCVSRATSVLPPYGPPTYCFADLPRALPLNPSNIVTQLLSPSPLAL
jgi:hypothetical protein